MQSVQSAVRSILDAGPVSVRLLVPEKDFSDRQSIRFSGFKTVYPPSIPFIGKGSKESIYSAASSEPYGGGPAEMSWKSRWIEISEKP